MAKVNTLESGFEIAADSKVSDELLEKLANVNKRDRSTSQHKTFLQDEPPSVSLNTRIPRSLSEKIDDLIYVSKKRGILETKQSLTIKAIENYVNACLKASKI